HVRVGNTNTNMPATSANDASTTRSVAARDRIASSMPLAPHPTGQRAAAEVRGGLAELSLDAQQLVVLRDAVGARERARLDLAAIRRDREVGDRRVLGLAAAVGH